MGYHDELAGADLHVFGVVSATDPGAIGALKAWIDTSADPVQIWLRNAANLAWLGPWVTQVESGAVDSVNGATGTVVLTAASVGAIDALLKGAANGVAELGADSKVPTAQLPDAVLGAMSYQGVWNATTNSPALASGVGTKGHYYKVSVAGTTELDGISEWKVGDWVVSNGTTWDKVDNTEPEYNTVYVALAGDQTVAGEKTFSTSPKVPTPTTNTQVANKEYVDDAVSLVNDFSIIPSSGVPSNAVGANGDWAIDIVNGDWYSKADGAWTIALDLSACTVSIYQRRATPPAVPVDDTKYIVTSPATGDWTGKENYIAYGDGGVWAFELPDPRTIVWVSDENALYVFSGTWHSIGGAAATTFLSLTDTPASYVADKWLKVNSAANAIELVDAPTATDEKVKVSSNDSTAGYLNGKLVAGTGISLTEGSDGGNEILTIAATGGSSATYPLAAKFEPWMADSWGVTRHALLRDVYTIPNGDYLIDLCATPDAVFALTTGGIAMLDFATGTFTETASHAYADLLCTDGCGGCFDGASVWFSVPRSTVTDHLFFKVNPSNGTITSTITIDTGAYNMSYLRRGICHLEGFIYGAHAQGGSNEYYVVKINASTLARTVIGGAYGSCGSCCTDGELIYYAHGAYLYGYSPDTGQNIAYNQGYFGEFTSAATCGGLIIAGHGQYQEQGHHVVRRNADNTFTLVVAISNGDNTMRLMSDGKSVYGVQSSRVSLTRFLPALGSQDWNFNLSLWYAESPLVSDGFNLWTAGVGTPPTTIRRIPVG